MKMPSLNPLRQFSSFALIDGSKATLLALLFAVGCGGGDGHPSVPPQGGSGGDVGGSGGGPGGSGGSPGGSGGTAGRGGSGGSTGGSGGSTGGSGGSTGGSGGSTGGSGGSTGGSGGVAGRDGSAPDTGGGNGGAGGAGGGGTPSAFVPCNTMPAMTAPALKKTTVTTLPGGVQAGQVVGVPGETRIYIVGHKNGNIYTIDAVPPFPKTAEVVMGAQVSVATGGNNEQGLLSMVLHPQFAMNHRYYVFYASSAGGAMTIDEFIRLTPTTAMKNRNIYSKARTGGGGFHNGGTLFFDPKAPAGQYLLYMSVGNNSSGESGSTTGVSGRINRFEIKIEPDSVALAPGQGMGAATYGYGLRNPYRMSIDQLTGDMWIGDVNGPQGGTIHFNPQGKEGSNFGFAGANQGASVRAGIQGGVDSSGNAIIGGVVYRGSLIPEICGRYFYGLHNTGLVKSLIQSGGTRIGDVQPIASLNSSGLSSFGADGSGEIYISTLGGAVAKVEKN
jgi:glucose/arabinose dehydrogenase